MRTKGGIAERRPAALENVFAETAVRFIGPASAGRSVGCASWPQIAAWPASASHATLTQMMEVTDANVAGNVHGGVVMRLADTAAGLAAFRHAGGLA